MEEKGLDDTTADQIGQYVQLNGGIELIDVLLQNEHLMKSELAVKGLEAMKLLLTYCNILGLKNEVLFDLSLARGLDYYTGIIFEAVLKNEPQALSNGSAVNNEEAGSVGSIAGGGRYDNLVGIFDMKGKQVPCVGVSIGVERIFSVLEAKYAAQLVLHKVRNCVPTMFKYMLHQHTRVSARSAYKFYRNYGKVALMQSIHINLIQSCWFSYNIVKRMVLN